MLVEPVDWLEPALTLSSGDEAIDGRLADLASLALVAIEQQFAAGTDDASVRRIIATVFGQIEKGWDVSQAPDRLGGSAIGALVEDPAELQRITQTVRDILGRQ